VAVLNAGCQHWHNRSKSAGLPRHDRGVKAEFVQSVALQQGDVALVPQP
jgi:hypothetical protein